MMLTLPCALAVFMALCVGVVLGFIVAAMVRANDGPDPYDRDEVDR